MSALKVIGLIVLGAALSAAGLIGWYHWGRSTPAEYSIPIGNTTNSDGGMKPSSCQINGSQSEALAYGVFTVGADSGSNNLIQLYVVGAHQKLLGSASEADVNTAGQWTLQAHLLQGFGPPLDCYVQIS